MIVKSKKITGANNIFLKATDGQKKIFSSKQEGSEQSDLMLEKANNPIFLDEVRLSEQRIFITFPKWITSREKQLFFMIRDGERLAIFANKIEGDYLYFTNSYDLVKKKIVIPNDDSNRFLIREINNRSKGIRQLGEKYFYY